MIAEYFLYAGRFFPWVRKREERKERERRGKEAVVRARAEDAAAFKVKINTLRPVTRAGKIVFRYKRMVVRAELIKENAKTVWVKLMDGHIIKRKKARDLPAVPKVLKVPQGSLGS